MSTRPPRRPEIGPPLFVYGTLLCPEVWSLVVGAPVARRVAWLHDHRRGPIAREVFPGVVPDPGALVDGALVDEPAPAARARLDAYEGPLYNRDTVRVQLADGRLVVAETYLIAAPHRHLVGPGEWSLAAFREGPLAAFVAALRDELT